MKVFIVLASFVALASAGHLHQFAGPAALSTGSSSQFRTEDNFGNYNFGYDENHATGGSSRREEEINGIRRGMYSLRDADGRQRIVNYIADDTGFHANIQTNEPGVEPKDPADVLINKAQLAGPAPFAAPLPAPLPAPFPAPLPAPLPAPAPLALPAPAPLPLPAASAPFGVKGGFTGFAPRAPVTFGAPIAAPAPIAGPAPIAAGPVVVEADIPRAFSYSFGADHVAPAPRPLSAPVFAAPLPLPVPAPAPLPLPAPAPLPLPLPAPLPVPAPAPIHDGPIFQQQLEY